MSDPVDGRCCPTYSTDLGAGLTLLDAVAGTSLTFSSCLERLTRGAARRLIKDGAVYVNDRQERDPARLLTRADMRPATEYFPAAVWISTRNRRSLLHLIDEEPTDGV